MKGLLLKDWYMMKKYCKAYLVIAIVFIAVSFVSDENLFFVFYPCLLCGMIPVNLFGYDERSRWTQYCATMPYTKAQIVSAKYIIGLLTQVVLLAVIGAVQLTKSIFVGDPGIGERGALMLMVLAISTLSSAIPLPFLFKLGVEKGRIAYYVMIGFVCGAAVLASGLVQGQLTAEARINLVVVVLAAVGIMLYALSWYLSIVFYKRREIQ